MLIIASIPNGSNMQMIKAGSRLVTMDRRKARGLTTVRGDDRRWADMNCLTMLTKLGGCSLKSSRNRPDLQAGKATGDGRANPRRCHHRYAMNQVDRSQQLWRGSFRFLVVGYEPCEASDFLARAGYAGGSAHDGLHDQVSDNAHSTSWKRRACCLVAGATVSPGTT